MSENGAMKSGYQVVATMDFSELCDRGIEQALTLCGSRADAVLHVIVVATEEEDGIRLPGPAEQLVQIDEANELSRAHVGRLVEAYQLKHGEVAMEKIAVYVASGHPAERIVALSVQVDADVIVLGTHSRTGLPRLLVGSVAEEVVRRAPCSVYIIRPRDFLNGEKLPQVEPPLKPGEHALQPFQHAPTYHYVNRISNVGSHMMPAI